MSRGIKDLRDLICVSRLTVRHSDDEIFSSDEERADQLCRSFSSASVGGTDPSRENSATSRVLNSPDSGIATNGNSPKDASELKTINGAPKIPHPPEYQDDEIPRAFRKKKRKKKKTLDLVPTRHELPKVAPLPPVSSLTHSRPSSCSSEDSNKQTLYSNSNLNTHYTAPETTNFDNLLTYLDGTVVSEWLQIANANVKDMATWCHAGENFVQFAHFWLSQFPDIQKNEIFKLEYSIVVDNLTFGFAAGHSSGSVKHKDINQFVRAIFREYPEKVLSLKGHYLFLDYLDVLSSERQDCYRSLLSDVKCSTRIKQHAQWILATRSFALVSIWSSVLNFYRRLVGNTDNASLLADPVPLAAVNKNDPNQVRMYHAIRNGYTEVVQYLIKSNKVNPLGKDLHNKNLLFTAVMLNQPKVLNFLLNNVKPCADINAPADTGNTALHAAANSGNCEIVDIIIKAKGINVNVTNPLCEDATPLHLAVMHGHVKVVEILLKAKANVHLKMGELTAMTIAEDFGHSEIVTLLKSYV